MNLDLRTYSTFTIGGIAHKVFEIREKGESIKIHDYAMYINKPLVIIGEGSNSIFGDTTNKYIIGLMRIMGIEILEQKEDIVLIKAYGGEYWDSVVAWAVDHGLSGLEALSGIPGTAGSAPIQNIGAYGAELSHTFFEAEVFDRTKGIFTTLTHKECNFGYRDSIFKQNPHTYIILSITLKLSTKPAPIPKYKDVEEFFIQKQNPSTKEIRDAIIQIRKSKIPNYKTHPNCGSFFKNPIVTKQHLESLQKKYPTIPSFELPNEMYKVFTGWLIEQVKYKEAETGTIVFNEKNKLVLINKNNGTFGDLQLVISRITKLVKEAYDITLEIEPNIFE